MSWQQIPALISWRSQYQWFKALPETRHYLSREEILNMVLSETPPAVADVCTAGRNRLLYFPGKTLED
jgi:hypothetical protein